MTAGPTAARSKGWFCAALLLCCPTAEAQERERVDRGLAFLTTQQEPDGAWQLHGQKSPAVTGLAVMAFLSAGHVPGEGPYQEQLDRAIRWVLRAQDRTGLFAPPGSRDLYTHAI